MTSCFFIYNIDEKNALSNIWVVNDTNQGPLIIENIKEDKDALESIMDFLEIENINNSRFMYLGIFNLKPYSENEIECFALDVTKFNMSVFNEHYGVKSIPAYTLCNNENSILHALAMKYILLKRKTAEIKKEVNVNDSETETLDNI